MAEDLEIILKECSQQQQHKMFYLHNHKFEILTIISQLQTELSNNN